MRFFVCVATILCLSAYDCDCDDSFDCQPKAGTTNSVILMFDGKVKTSMVGMVGSYCWVEWYKGIEKVLVKGDGTADDGSFHYRWELNEHSVIAGAMTMASQFRMH